MKISMNERTHFFIKIYLSHFILERVDVGCVWEVSWRWGQTAIYWPKVLLTIVAFFIILAELLNCWSLRDANLQFASWFSRWHLVPQLTPTATATRTELTQSVCSTWLYNCLTPTCFMWAYASAPNSTTSTGQGVSLIYTGASLDWRLGRGSICYNMNLIYLHLAFLSRDY